MTAKRRRVLVHTPRLLNAASPAISPHLEFEDLIAEFDDAELIAPELRSSPLPLFKVANRLGKATSRGQALNLAHRPVTPKADDYDLFFALLLCPDDALQLNAVRGWRERSGVAVAWVIEAWLQDLDTWQAHWEILSQFDHIFVTMEPCREPIAAKTGVPTHYLPYGTDALLFAPREPALDRPIDVMSIGRRSEETHQHLLRSARDGAIYYQFDTIHASEVRDHPQHRFMYASQAQRSKFFIANRSKIGADHETGGQHEFGGRFFDSAAAGATWLGEFPDTDRFREAFDWDGPGVPIGHDADPILVIEAAAQDPAGVEAARCRSIAECLGRHDWMHRWETILEAAGLEGSDGMARRSDELHARRARFSTDS